MVSDFCFVIIKHDALEIKAENLILDRLEKAGLVTCCKKITSLSGEQLDTIYEDVRGEPFYDRMKNMVTGKPAICLVVGGVSDVSKTAKLLKGKPTEPGTIRGDLSYLHQLTAEQKQAFEAGTYVTHEKTGRSIHDHIFMDDRFHSSETSADSRRAMMSVFTIKELNDIYIKYPAFNQFINS